MRAARAGPVAGAKDPSVRRILHILRILEGKDPGKVSSVDGDAP